MTRLACIIIAHERRRDLVHDFVEPSVYAQDFDEVVTVGDWVEVIPPKHRYLHVRALTSTTLDALVKRDVGTLATTADTLVYLNDDHTLDANFANGLRAALDEPWDVLVPNRYTVRNGKRIALNNGERDQYCGGHSGVFRRALIQQRPWSAQYHTPYWDLVSSRWQVGAGARFVWEPRAEIAVCDIEPGVEPWK